MVRFLIIGDLHGQKPRIYFRGFDAIIAPGDFCSDKIRKYFKGWEKARKNNGKFYRGSGEYALAHYSKRVLDKAERESLQRGREILEFLNSFGKPVFIIPGNWDQSFAGKEEGGKNGLKNELVFRHKLFSADYTNKKLTRGLKNIHDCQFRNFVFEGYNILGYGLNMVPELPGGSFPLIKRNKRLTKVEKVKVVRSYYSLFEKLDRVYRKRNRRLPSIFLSHNMPYNTRFDQIISPRSPLHGVHYGSNIARDFIVKRKPLVCIGGHMHEHFGKMKLAKTVVINAGFGAKVNTLLELENGKIKRLKFYR